MLFHADEQTEPKRQKQACFGRWETENIYNNIRADHSSMCPLGSFAISALQNNIYI